MGKDYICLADKTKSLEKTIPRDEYLRKDCPAIPDDLLEIEFSYVQKASEPVSNAIKKLLNITSEYNQYRNYLSTEIIAKLIRNVRTEIFRDSILSTQSVISPMEELELKEINSHLNGVMEYVTEKIESQYLSTGKITQEKANIYRNALRDVLNDLLQRRNGSSYFRHLKSYLPELTQKQYRDEERSIFEYLAKIAKREFRKKLSQLL
jgi:hypothetical protein